MRQHLRLAVLVLVIAGLGWGGHYVQTHGSSTVHAFGRDYQRSASHPLTLHQVQRTAAGPLVIVNHGRLVAGTAGLYAPTVIYVEQGDRYWPYELQGGP